MATTYKWRRYNTKTERVPYTYWDTESYWDKESYTAYETETYQEYTGRSDHGTRDFTSLSAATNFAADKKVDGYETYVDTGVMNDGTRIYVVGYSKSIYVTKTRQVPVTKSKDVLKYRDVQKTGYRDQTVKGTYIDEVKSTNRKAYPDNGISGSYYYEYGGVANQAPSLTGSEVNIGSVKGDFDISYTVNDADGDEVKVQIMVDDTVIQYPMPVPLGRSQTVKIRLSDYSLGDHKVVVTATDTNNASASRTHTFKKTNQAPSISGSDLDLGAKYQDVQVEYIIQDADGDAVKVEIKLDDTIVQTPTTTTLGIRRTYTAPIKSLGLGRHSIEIIATDSQGASSVRRYTFEKVNSAPTISGSDMSLGPKNTGFTYVYQVTDKEADNVKVIERLNGVAIRTISNTPLDSDLSVTITNEQIREYELNKVNTIEIEATDGTATAYRRVTFVRNNMAPIIADSDKDLGEVSNELTYSWSATDPEKDKMFATIYLDDVILEHRHEITDGANQSIEIKGLDMFKLSRGKHTLKIEVSDEKEFSSTRTISFTRKVERLVMQLAKNGDETDELATRINVTKAGVHVAKGAKVKYEVCNNSFDKNPTWENATSMTLAGKAYVFQNKTKTAAKAGINIRITIEKADATAFSYINAIGGAID